MWNIWLKSGSTWIESTKQYVEETEARAEAAKLKAMFYMDVVFIQFDMDDLIEIV